MKCPNCKHEIMPAEMSIELGADEDNVEVNFVCSSCEIDHYTILTSDEFIPVD